MTDLILTAQEPDGGDAVSTTNDREPIGIGQSGGYTGGTGAKCLPFEHTHRPVPDHRPGFLDPRPVIRDGLRSDVQPHPARRDRLRVGDPALGRLFELPPADVVAGQQQIDLLETKKLALITRIKSILRAQVDFLAALDALRESGASIPAVGLVAGGGKLPDPGGRG